VSGLVLAIRYLTILPLPGPAHAPADRLGRAAGWFPYVGLVVGLLLAGADGVFTRFLPPLVSAVLTVTVWKLLTGGLHLDGLADCLDGMTGRDPEHRLAIMRDSRIGAFGAIGLVLILVLAVAAVLELPTAVRWPALVIAPTIGRAVPPLLARLFGPARREGQGAAFVAGVGRAGAATALAVALLVSVAVLGAVGAVAAVLAAGVTAGGAWYLARRLDGLTGDVLGAAVEVAELTAVLAVLAWSGPRA
jgi:adenosylcobinamide-GDP ribazoletransferase